MLENGDSQVIMEVVTDPGEQAKARASREQFRRNAAWLEAHAGEVFSQYRGKCICVAGEELFVADTPEVAYERAQKAHPKEQGLLLRYIPLKNLPRIYANCR